MGDRLKDKVAIITGAAKGIGFATAQRFAQEGAKVIIADICGDAAKAVADRLGGNASAFTCDVSIADSVQALVDYTVKTFGIPNIVVNNAGVTHLNRPMLEVTEAEFDRVYDINVKSIFHMAHAVVPLMRKNKGGVILNVGSTAGIRPRPGLTWYNGSKAAVNIISKSMAVELGPDKIRVNAICPVLGETGMFTQFMGMPDTPENRAKFLGSIPLGRFSLPSDVAAAALFLASPEAEFFTGVELPVDGGRTV
jgi:3-oxoacyl-[acyl-carrier protein] reductase